MPLPKVLIINQPFNNDTGAGITTTNLFKGWEKDRLAAACSSHLLLIDNIDTSICDNYYQLGYSELYTIFPFKLLQKKYKSGVVHFSSEKLQNLSVKKSKSRAKFIMSYLFPFLEYLGIYHFIHKSRLTEEFCIWLKAFNPDVIYVQPFSRDDVSFCMELHKFLDKPMVFHQMDDWPASATHKGLFRKYWNKKINKELKRLVDVTSIPIAISDFMAQEYKIRYNKDFVTFHNPIDSDFWKPSQKRNYTLKEPPVLLYAGRIGLGIEKSLQVIASAVKQVNEELRTGLKFVICAQEKPQWLNNYPCVEHRYFGPYREVPELFASADLLILPYDFSKDSIKFIKYSMPTKVTEYMISGAPIIVFAPEETALVQYVRQHACAKLVTENSVINLARALKELIQDKTTRESIAGKAKQAAEAFHDGNQVRDDFRKIISSLVSQNQPVSL